MNNSNIDVALCKGKAVHSISNCTVLETDSLSDHRFISFKQHLGAPLYPSELKERFNFHQIKWENINRDIKPFTCTLPSTFQNRSRAENYISQFIKILNDSCRRNISSKGEIEVPRLKVSWCHFYFL